MKRLPFLSFICLAILSCGRTQAEKDLDAQKQVIQADTTTQISQSVSNLEEVGLHLEVDGKPAEGSAIRSQADVIWESLKALTKTFNVVIERKMPTVTFSQWQAAKDDAQASRSLAEKLNAENVEYKNKLNEKNKKLDELQAKVEEEEKLGWWRKLASGGFLATLTAAGLWIARLVGVPGVNLISDPLLRLVAGKIITPIEAKAQTLEKTAQAASTAIMASDAARAALGLLQQRLASSPELAEKIKEFLLKATNGKASDLEGIFKMVAKGVAVDEGQHGEVDALLKQVRAIMPTELGTPVAALKVFSHAT